MVKTIACAPLARLQSGTPPKRVERHVVAWHTKALAGEARRALFVPLHSLTFAEHVPHFSFFLFTEVHERSAADLAGLMVHP